MPLAMMFCIDGSSLVCMSGVPVGLDCRSSAGCTGLPLLALSLLGQQAQVLLHRQVHRHRQPFRLGSHRHMKILRYRYPYLAFRFVLS
jgi:hypothetical protein